MNSLPNTNLPATAYMNGSPIAAGSNPSLQSSVIGNGVMGNMGGGLMVGQMPLNATQQHQAAAMYHYQQHLQAQQMNPYAKVPTQMMNTGGPIMAVAQDGLSQVSSLAVPGLLLIYCSPSLNISLSPSSLCYSYKQPTCR